MTPEATPTYVNGEPVIEETPAAAAPASAPDPEPPAEQPSEPTKPDSQLDDVERQVAHREWTFTGDFQVTGRDGGEITHHFERTYVQKPLSYTAMLQFTGLIGDKIAEAMTGEGALTVDGIVGEADGLISAGRSVLTRQDFSGVDSFVRGLAKLSIHVPDIIEDCQCIWLRIPLAERPMVKEIWARSPEDGGLSIADGEGMLTTFIEQNYDEVEDFFVVRLPRIVKRAREMRERHRGSANGGSPPSKPSSHTAPITRSP